MLAPLEVDRRQSIGRPGGAVVELVVVAFVRGMNVLHQLQTGGAVDAAGRDRDMVAPGPMPEQCRAAVGAEAPPCARRGGVPRERGAASDHEVALARRGRRQKVPGHPPALRAVAGDHGPQRAAHLVADRPAQASARLPQAGEAEQLIEIRSRFLPSPTPVGEGPGVRVFIHSPPPAFAPTSWRLAKCRWRVMIPTAASTSRERIASYSASCWWLYSAIRSGVRTLSFIAAHWPWVRTALICR